MPTKYELEKTANQLLNSKMDPRTGITTEEQRRRTQDLRQRNARSQRRRARHRQEADVRRQRFEAEIEAYNQIKPEAKT